MPENRHSIIGEGTDVGIIGGLAVAVWFLILDVLAGHPFQTPSLLGQTVLLGDRTPDATHLAFGAILFYTAFHFIVFALIGMGLVALVHWGIENPVVRYALLPVFLVFEVLFYGFLGSSPSRPTPCSRSGPSCRLTPWPRSAWRPTSGAGTRPSGRASMTRRSVQPPGDLVR